MKNFQDLIDLAKKWGSATGMVLYEVTMNQMAQNLNILAKMLKILMGWVKKVTGPVSVVHHYVRSSCSDCSSNNIIEKHACRCQQNCDAYPPQIPGVGVFWRQKEDCFIPWILFLISSWNDNKIQWEHCCNCNILLGTKLQANRKSFTFPFSEWLDKKEKIVTTRLLDRVVKFFE